MQQVFGPEHISQVFCYKVDKVAPKRQFTLEEPHGEHVEGEYEDVLVELDGISEGYNDSEHRHVLVRGEVTVDVG